jgi:hypothetical protein
MSRVLQEITVYFQWLPIVVGGSVRHTCNMKRRKSRLISLLPPGPRTVIVTHYPRGGPSSSTLTGGPCTAGTGRPFAVEIVEKMPTRGKPAFQSKIRHDQIAAYVQFLKEADPGAKMDEGIIPEVAEFFDVDKKTVWNALRQHRQLEPGKPILSGPITFKLRKND